VSRRTLLLAAAVAALVAGAVLLVGRLTRTPPTDENVDAVLARGAKGTPLAALVPGEASAHRFECRLEREPDGWRIVEASWRAVDLADAIAGPPEPAP
jgi:hypothetical protein